MDNIELRNKIKSLNPWYQNIKFNEEIAVVSSHSRYSGEWAWEYIKQLLPDIAEKRILDLGSNAGLFSIRCCKGGAREVIGIENNNKHLRQANFLKEYYNCESVEFKKANLEELPDMNMGKFDLVLAIAVLYWVGRKIKPHYHKENREREIEFIKFITGITDVMIVRCRGTQYNNSEYYGEIFMRFGFNIEKVLTEREGTHENILFKRD